MAINTDTGLTPEALRPQASPVNRYVPPTAGSGLAQLAEGLAAFNPALQRFRAGVAEDDMRAGAAAAQKAVEARMTFNEAIDAGLITRSQSPFFRQAFRRQYGRLTADRYTQELRLAMEEEGLWDDLLSMEEFDEFEAEFRQRFEEQHLGDGQRDSDFEEAYLAQKSALMEQYRQGVVTAIGQNMEKRVAEGLHQEIHNALVGFSSEVTPEDMGAYIQALIDEARENRTVTNRRANDAALNAILAAAELTGREDILDVAQHIQAGQHSLIDRPEASQRIVEARDRIKRRNELEAERLEVERVNTVLDGVFEQYINARNPYEVDVESAIRELQSIGGEAARRGVGQLFELRRTLEVGLLETSSLLMGELTARASAGSVTMEELRSRVFRGEIRPDEFAFLVNLLPRPEGGVLPDRPEEQLAHIESHPIYKSIKAQIEASYGPIDMLDEEAGVAMQEQLRRIRFDLADWYFDGGGHAYTREQLQDFELSYVTHAMERYRPEIEAIYRTNQGRYGSPRVQGEPTITRWEFEGLGRALESGDQQTLAAAARMWNMPPDPQAFVDLYNNHIQFFGGEPIEIAQAQTSQEEERPRLRRRLRLTGPPSSAQVASRIQYLERELAKLPSVEEAQRIIAEGTPKRREEAEKALRRRRNIEAELQTLRR